MALEWPVEGLEPLSFVLGRVLDPLCTRLERADVGAAVLHVHLKLVTKELYTRTLQLPMSIKDPKVLRTLILLDLASHPPAAGIDQVTVRVDQVPARTQQFSLLEQVQPSPEKMSVLMARLTALVGEGRCGSPGVLDSYGADRVEMRAFAPADPSSNPFRARSQPRSASWKTKRTKSDTVRETAIEGDWRRFGACSGASPLRPMLRRYRAPGSRWSTGVRCASPLPA